MTRAPDHMIYSAGGLVCHDQECPCTGQNRLRVGEYFTVAELVAALKDHRRANGVDDDGR